MSEMTTTHIDAGAARLSGPRRASWCAFASLSALLAACSEQPPVGSTAPSAQSQPTAPQASIHFTDVTRETGIDFTTTSGVLPSREILEVNGTGMALIDFDNDGDLDVFTANGATLADPERGPGCRLYRNEGNLRFIDVTSAAKIDVHRWAMGVAAADVDGDRFDDLFIACYGPDILLRNNRDGTFSDVSQQAGIANESSWGTSAAFGDIDNDGDLDLYVANYLEFDVSKPPPRARYKDVEVMAGPHGLKPQHDFLYQNQGDGTFRNIAQASGAQPAQPAFGLNVVILDFDNNGWQDIIVANDSMPGFYFRNKGIEKGIEASRHQGIEGAAPEEGPLDASMSSALMPSFEEIGVISGVASNIDGANQACMGIAIADVDDNGFPDKFTTVFSSDTNTLHLNVDGRFFEDRSTSYGLGMVSRPFLGWACGFFDFDRDGDEDLLMFNGHVYPEATMSAMDSDYLQTPLLFARDGNKFRRVDANEAGAWLDEHHRDRSAVFGDLDGDGDVDVLVSELNGPLRVLRNDATATDATWLTVALRDERAGSKNHHGIGARIELIEGDRTQRRWIFSGGGFQSSSEMAAHFGLSEATDSSNLKVRVLWPDGFEQILDSVLAGRHLIVRRTQG